MKLKKVAFSVYPIKDMAKSRAFYEGVLGLAPGEDFNGGWQEYDLGGTTFAVSTMISEYVKPGSQSAVSFEVDDVKKYVEQLKAKGLTLENDTMETPVCWMAFVKDPDGNSIGLHQVKQ